MIPTLKTPGTIRFGVFVPSEPITQARWKRILTVEKLLRLNGFDAKFASNIRKITGSVAGNIETRISALTALLQDPSVHVLCGAWGGRGCIELIEHLDYSKFAEARKPIMGVSDIAVLLNAITARSGLVTFFGPNVYGKLNESPITNMNFLANDGVLSTGKNILPKVRTLKPVRDGVVNGKLFGGSLDTFVHANAGTTYCIPAKGNIFFWETSRFDPQRIRQQIYSLRIRRVFDDLGGMIIGDIGVPLSDSRWPSIQKFKFLSDLLADLSIPILYAPVFGHGKSLPSPVFPIGAKVTLNATEGTLVLRQPILKTS